MSLCLTSSQEERCPTSCTTYEKSIKRAYIENTLNKHKNKPKKLWQDIREFWPSGKAKHSKINNIQGHQNSEEIANILNDHFSSIGESINKSIVTNSSIDDYPLEYHPPIFDLQTPSLEDIHEAIDRLN